jgi:hypothetical protein
MLLLLIIILLVLLLGGGGYGWRYRGRPGFVGGGIVWTILLIVLIVWLVNHI